MTAEQEYLIEKLIERLIEIDNPYLGDDALVDAYQDVNKREEAIAQIKEYLE